MPSFPGGKETLDSFVSTHLIYPEMARTHGVEGKVIVTFTVAPGGKLTKIALLGNKMGWGCDEEAIRIVSSMPTWIPGTENGKQVSMGMVLTIKFRLPQTTDSTWAMNEVLEFAEQMPEYSGGTAKMNEFILNNLIYPPKARENGMDGKVTIAFVVDANGNLRDIEVVGRKSDWGFEEEAVRIVKLMPAWKPGRQNGEKVSVKYSIPIRFKL